MGPADLIDHELLRLVDELLEKYRLPPADRPELEKFLRDVRAESFEDGYDDGHRQGYAAGRDHGREKSYGEGYRNGHADGCVKILDTGT